MVTLQNRSRLLFIFLAIQLLLMTKLGEASDDLPQTGQQDPRFTLERVAKNIWSDQKSIWETPFRMNSQKWLTIGIPFAATTAGLVVTDERSSTMLPNTSGQRRWCGRISHMGAILSGKLSKQPQLLRIGKASAEALASAAVVGYVIKAAAARERPEQNNGQGRFSGVVSVSRWGADKHFPSDIVVEGVLGWFIGNRVARRSQ
jgi:hypothetical protein